MSSSSKRSDDARKTGQPQQARVPRYSDGFGQPATDSQRLRQFAYEYEDNLRHTGAQPASFDMRDTQPHAASWLMLVGLALFVVLLAVAMALALLLIHPR